MGSHFLLGETEMTTIIGAILMLIATFFTGAYNPAFEGLESLRNAANIVVTDNGPDEPAEIEESEDPPGGS